MLPGLNLLIIYHKILIEMPNYIFWILSLIYFILYMLGLLTCSIDSRAYDKAAINFEASTYEGELISQCDNEGTTGLVYH
jgi:hypothetical protein